MAHAVAPTRAPLPRPIERLLVRVDIRLRAIAALRGFGASASAASVLAMLGMAADFFWILPREARWGCWLIAVVVVGAVLVASSRKLVARRAPLELAAMVERVVPDPGELLTGAVGLLAHGRSHGSPALITALANDASAHADMIESNHVAPARQAARWFLCGLGAVALVSLPGVIHPDPFATLARRFLAPWAEIERAGRYSVAVAPGHAVAAIGDDLTVSATVTSRLGRFPAAAEVSVEWTDLSTGRTHRRVMEEPSNSAARLFAMAMPKLTGSFDYRVKVGRVAESRWFRVEVVVPPSIARLSARVEPPGYTRYSAFNVREPNRIEAWEDSRVTLTIHASAPVRSIEVAWPNHRYTSAILDPSGLSGVISLAAEASGEYSIALRGANGLASRPDRPRRVIIRPDEPPVFSTRGMEGLGESRPDDTLRLEVAARDDVAVAAADLHYSIARARSATSEEPEAGKVAASLQGLDTPSARGTAALGLKELELEAGDVVTYRVRVLDNRPSPRGPNEAWSPSATLTIVPNAEPLRARQLEASRDAVRARLDTLKHDAAETRRETQQLRYAADAAQRGASAWTDDDQRNVVRREADSRALVEGLLSFSEGLDAEPDFRPLARPARQVADDEAAPARLALERALEAEDEANRLAALSEADAHLGAVVQGLDDLQRLLDDRQRFHELADRQEQLAEQAERPRLDEARAQEEAVRESLQNLLKDQRARRGDEVKEPAKHALESTREAIRRLDEARDPDAEQSRSDQALETARRAMREAADRLHAAARATDPADRHDAVADSNSGDAQPGSGGTAAPAESGTLQEILLRHSGRAWGELPGHLRSELLQMSQSRYRDDYARLIQLYYREIAAGGDAGKRERRP